MRCAYSETRGIGHNLIDAIIKPMRETIIMEKMDLFKKGEDLNKLTGAVTLEDKEKVVLQIDFTKVLFGGDLDKSIAAKWLIAGEIHERSWNEAERIYTINKQVKNIFISLLTEEESASLTAKVMYQFGGWANDLNGLSEQAIGKEESDKIHAVTDWVWEWDSLTYDRNMLIVVGRTSRVS
jgi:hypothetical protein